MVGELTESQWKKIAPLLPPPKGRGRHRADDRRTLNGILWVLRTGARWQDLPREYGSDTTCHRRLQDWQREGIWERIWQVFLKELDEEGKLGWSRAFLDGTFVPAKKGGQAVGLTRKGKGTKVMLVVDGGGIPIGALVESAQRAEVKLADSTLATVKVPRARGRPRSRPKEVVADKGYDSDPLRQRWRRRGIKPCIPRRRNRKPRRGRKPDLEGYSYRWIVERTFSWLGNFRRLVVCWERHAHIYLAFLLIACAVISLRFISG